MLLGAWDESVFARPESLQGVAREEGGMPSVIWGCKYPWKFQVKENSH